ncbi:MAG: S49 family peptidase [Thermoproteota archaeon]
MALAIVCVLAASAAGYFFLARHVSRKDAVGVISVSGAIVFSEDVERYVAMINRAITNDSIRAVVLRIDSPGGYVDLVEQVYLDLLELKKAKPVVASITFAASGGYYIAVAADYICAEPTTFVGNVGVIGTVPPTLIPSEVALETGPYKATGLSELLFPFNLSAALDNFVSAVEKGRGDRLRLTPSQLKKGLLYLGSEAVEVGLVDEIGSLQKAIKEATGRAGLREYEVVDLNVAVGVSSGLGSSSNQTPSLDWRGLTLEALSEIRPPPSILYLYLQPGAIRQSASEDGDLVSNGDFASGGAGERTVLVDDSHGNKVSAWQLDVLMAELAIRNATVRFVPSWRELEQALSGASCLIVASPADPYSAEEAERIERFVSGGGILALFYDPAYEYVEIPGLFGPINSLSARFGLSFAKGYLYNEVENYGIYRNVYVKAFADNRLPGAVPRAWRASSSSRRPTYIQ